MKTLKIRSYCLGLIAFIFFVPMLAGANTCVSNENLVQLDLHLLGKIKPCSKTGRLFLTGLGFNQSIYESFEETEVKAPEYYSLTRIYLIKSKSYNQSPDFSIGAFSYLISALTVLPNESSEIPKSALYKMFILAEYWHLNFKNDGIDQRMFHGVIEELNSFVEIKNTLELRCLVLADMPGTPVSELKTSPVYEDCMSWQKTIIKE